MRKVSSVLTAAALAAVASAAVAAPARAAGVTGEYVALGDSYASGVGAFKYKDTTCRQSEDSYPRQLVRTTSGLTLKDQTCTGATIDDVSKKQLGALGGNTKLVTLTVGGNDADFGDGVRACLTGTDDACAEAVFSSSLASAIVTPPRLQKLLVDIKGKAPKARVVVVGYPRLIDEGTGSCGVVSPNAKKRGWMNVAADYAVDGAKSATAKAKAAGVNVTFLDVRDTFKGRQACVPGTWINGVDLNAQAEIFHPNRDGYAAYARALKSHLG